MRKNLFVRFFLSFLSPPEPYGEEEKKMIASYLRIFLLVSIILLPVYVLIKIIGEGFLPSAFINFGLALICAFLLYTLNKGRIILSGILFLLIAWIAMTAMAWYADGVQDMAIPAYILIIFLATLFSGIRFASVITLMSIISVWVFAVMQDKGIISYTGDKPLNYSRDYTIIFAMVLTAIILLSRSFRQSLNRVNWELKERIKAEDLLSKKEQILIEKNAELLTAKDKAEESNKLKTAFIQNLSHEIRTPMNGIVGFIDLLKNSGSDNEKKEEYFGIINSCTQQLVSLVNDLIDISKIEAGAIELNNSEFRAVQLKKELENTFSGQAAEKGLKLIISDEIGTKTIKSDHSKIRLVMNHLVSNAVKFTLDGSVTVRISQIENKLSVSVKDTGIGIRESDKGVIFDRFRQAENELNRTYGGSGLGLAISKGIVDFMGGKIWFESQSDKGSEFTFSIPVEFSEEKEIPKQIPPVEYLTQSLKILAAEDEEISYLYLKELLSTSKCKLTWAKNGLEAVEIIKNNSDFDIVLMDLKMPVMNGYEATEKIKILNSNIPVIAVTSFIDQEDMGGPIGTNFSGLVVKPIEKCDLLRVISNVTNI
jgi:signal transduction histidine kinase/CheY-like chemotaxis protein